MATTETKAAEKIADELMRIDKAAPNFRMDQLGSSAKAIRAHVESGDIAEEDARDNLIAAAVRAGLDGKDADDVVTWAWFGEHAPKVRELYPAAFPPEPEGFEEVAARLDAFDPARTGEHPTALTCAANGLACLADHLRSIDDRDHADFDDRWDLARETLKAAPDNVITFRSLVLHRSTDEHLAEGAALLVVMAVQAAVDLGVDVAEALLRIVPVAMEKSVVVQDQSAS